MGKVLTFVSTMLLVAGVASAAVFVPRDGEILAGPDTWNEPCTAGQVLNRVVLLPVNVMKPAIDNASKNGWQLVNVAPYDGVGNFLVAATKTCK